MISDLARIPIYIAASTLVLACVIVLVGRGANVGPGWFRALLVAFAIAAIGILFAKYGANFGLPWWIYYAVPMLATVLLPPVVFKFSLARAAAYVLLALATAPLIHAVFFYGVGWGDYMPFLRLPH